MPVDNRIYDRDAASWWSGAGHLSLLRGMLPARMDYLERVANIDPAGLDVLDLGCGGGLFSEALARRGARTCGLDPSARSIAVAREHAQEQGLSIHYREGRGEAIPWGDATFDLVCACDVLEHVEDLAQTVAGCARVLRPGGVLLYDTINRNPLTALVYVWLLQDWLAVVPRGLHAAEQFIRPAELRRTLAAHGLEHRDQRGLAPPMGPAAQWARLRAVLKLRGRRGQPEDRSAWTALAATMEFRTGGPCWLSYIGYACLEPDATG